jgi:Holliday junction resolvase RusA-like endonuclease
MTRQQLACLNFVRDYKAKSGGVSPSFDEIAVHLNLASKSGVARLLDALEEQGLVRRTRDRARQIEIIGRPAQSSGPHGQITFKLPAPPTTNQLFANVRGKGRVKTLAYRAWLQNAGIILNASRVGKRLTFEVPAAVTVRIGKCNQAKDADNQLKPVVDLLVAAGILRGDNLLHVHRVTAVKAFDEVPEGFVSVTVEAA